jgi:pimeloyl-ACP methyl ester carboxylesterase
MREHSFNSLGPGGFHRVHYYEWGDVNNPRVVMCVHGLTRNGRDFDALAENLSDRFRVICPDVIGRGKSAWLNDKEHYAYPQYCADMAALIARSGAHSVDWVGTSMGGIIGMLMASHNGTPVHRLVINDVGAFIPKAAIERIKAYVGKHISFDSFEEAEAYVRFVSAGFGPLTDTQWRHLTETSVIADDQGHYRLKYDPSLSHAFSGPVVDVDLWHVWESLSCPTLLIRGSDSDLLLSQTVEEMKRRGPSTRVVEFSGVGHAPMLMNEEQIRPVRDFLLEDDGH